MLGKKVCVTRKKTKIKQILIWWHMSFYLLENNARQLRARNGTILNHHHLKVMTCRKCQILIHYLPIKKKAKWCCYFTAEYFRAGLICLNTVSNLHLWHHFALNTNRNVTWRQRLKECSKCKWIIFISFSEMHPDTSGFHSLRFISSLRIILCSCVSILHLIIPWSSAESFKLLYGPVAGKL